jgi:hypothetical protein
MLVKCPWRTVIHSARPLSYSSHSPGPSNRYAVHPRMPGELNLPHLQPSPPRAGPPPVALPAPPTRARDRRAASCARRARIAVPDRPSWPRGRKGGLSRRKAPRPLPGIRTLYSNSVPMYVKFLKTICKMSDFISVIISFSNHNILQILSINLYCTQGRGNHNH